MADLLDVPSVPCRFCHAVPGQQCMAASGRAAAKPHIARVRLAAAVRAHAAAVRAHADPALDAHFPDRGPCVLCGVPGLGARHRVVDAIAGMLAAGEDQVVVAEEYGVPEAAVEAVARWSRRWPGVAVNEKED